MQRPSDYSSPHLIADASVRPDVMAPLGISSAFAGLSFGFLGVGVYGVTRTSLRILRAVNYTTANDLDGIFIVR